MRVILLFLFCIFWNTVYPQTFDYTNPYGATLVTEKKKNLEKGISIVCIYKTDLTEEDVASYYRELFLQQGFVETPTTGKGYRFQGEFKGARLFFSPSFFGEGENTYILTLYELANKYKVKAPPKDEQKIKVAIIREPHYVDFMPLYQGVKELEYIEWRSANPMLSIGYISHDDSNKVIEFYLKNMPEFGWELFERKPHTGTYELKQWASIIAPYSSFCTECIKERVPPLEIRGETLTFRNGVQRCVITVYTFDNVLNYLNNTKYDISFLEQYGTTIIGIAYFH